jgi:hypothetical protein
MRYGVDGTFHGETGYDELTSVGLWPWPNEDRIKRAMSAPTNGINTTRGFCSTGAALCGGPVTLTTYIWEFLDRSCPSEIVDLDHDGMPNWWETAHALNPTNPADAFEDDDEDECGNKEEWLADTDPQNNNSFLEVIELQKTNSMLVTFVCTNSRVYCLEYTSSLVTSDWSLVSGPTNGATGGVMTLIDTNDAAQRSYRVGVSIP